MSGEAHPSTKHAAAPWTLRISLNGDRKRQLAATKVLRSAIAAWVAGMLIPISPAQAAGRDCELDNIKTVAPSKDTPIQVRFAGVSTLVFSDRETTWMTDGFFTRPHVLPTVFGLIEPDECEIKRNLKRLGVSTLAAVVPVHSHYDHAMDSAVVARETQAELIGSASTLNVGYGLRPRQPKLHLIRANDTVALGKWSLTFYESNHGPTMPTMAARGTIDAPLEPASNARSWKAGAVWSIMVEHDNGPRMLVHASAGVPGQALEEALEHEKVDILFLGIGLLGRLGVTQEYRRTLWDKIVVASGAKRVILIHWDNFTKKLADPLECPPGFIDNVEKTLGDFRQWAETKKEKVELVMPPVFAPFDPSAGRIDGAGCGTGV